MIDLLYVVILAGGKGERFWPLSTPENPKPFLRLFSERSLLQQTFDRACRLVPNDRILLVVGRQHEKLVHAQLPDLPAAQILLEPEGRDTSAAIGYASLRLPAEALMLVMPADHLIPDNTAFADTIRSTAAFLQQHEGPVTFGIKPDRPETNYGYIKASQQNIGSPDFPIHPVEQFIEKPDRNAANEFILINSYYWNSGIFLWKVSRIRELLARHLPELWSGLQQIDGTNVAQKYAQLPKISIDYGVMQNADRVVVVPACFLWDDIGTWNSLLRVLPVSAEGNLVWGNHVGFDTSNCILYADSHTMATAGIQDLVVIQRGNQILICHQSYADRLKELLAKLSS